MDEGAAVKRWSFSTMQAVVGVLTGLISIVGAAYSAVDTLRPDPGPGEIVVAVRDAVGKPVSAPVVEVLGMDGTVLTTIIPGADGVARRALVAGPYRVRVVHPDFREAERAVQIQPDATTDLTLVLDRKPRATVATTTSPPSATRAPQTAARAAPRRSNPVDEAAASANRGIANGRRWLRQFGL